MKTTLKEWCNTHAFNVALAMILAPIFLAILEWVFG